MKTAKYLLILALILFACSDDDEQMPNTIQWKKLGLNGKTVNELLLNDSDLYVATTSGLFRKKINSNENFALLGFQDENVEAIELMPDGYLIASTYDRSGAHPPALYKSDATEQNWELVSPGTVNNEPILDLEVHSDGILYGTGLAVVARSEDEGSTWTPIYLNWGGIGTGIAVIEVNPNDKNELWAGGQGPIEDGFILRRKGDGAWDEWTELVENPTVVKEISFVDGNKDIVMAGFEGALLKTTNSGSDWLTLINSDENRFFFGVKTRAGDPNRLYAAGWLKGKEAQPLILFVSSDGGETFNQERFSDETFGGVMEMQIRTTEAADILYLGLDKGGVYEVRIPRQ